MPTNRFAFIKKEDGKYCVKSESNPDWSGGCYDTKGEAEKRLREVEFFKSKSAADTKIALNVALRFLGCR